MGYGWNTRSAEDVQRYNRSNYDFNKIKEAYDNTIPLRGKRKHLDIRPHGERNRTWERVVKVSDNEYYLTNTAYSYWDRQEVEPERNREHNRVMTFKMVGDVEYLTVHTPRKYWGHNTKLPFAERKELDTGGFIAPSSFYFYYYNLPKHLYMTKFGSKAYIQVHDENNKVSHYTLMQGDVVLTRKQGEEYFKPLVVHCETKLSIDRQQTKVIRKELEPFVNYVSVMAPLIEKNHNLMYSFRYPFNLKNYNEAGSAEWEGNWKNIIGKTWKELVSMKGDELPDYWYDMAQSYRSRLTTQIYNWDTRSYENVPINAKKIARLIYDDVYRQAKPFSIEEVELGKPFKNNKYHSW